MKQFRIFFRNIGLDEQNEPVLSSYHFLNSANQYEISEDPSQYCQSTLKSLTTGQKQICLLHADHMPIVIQGASKSIEECQHQFQDRHWNCSTVRDGTVFGPVLYHGNSAFTSSFEFHLIYLRSKSRNCIGTCDVLSWYNLCSESSM